MVIMHAQILKLDFTDLIIYTFKKLPLLTGVN